MRSSSRYRACACAAFHLVKPFLRLVSSPLGLCVSASGARCSVDEVHRAAPEVLADAVHRSECPSMMQNNSSRPLS